MKKLFAMFLTVVMALGLCALAETENPDVPANISTAEGSASIATVENHLMTLKIASYNIAAGRYNRDLTGICQDIIDCGADIIGLQEVDWMTNRCGNINMTAEIASKTGYPYARFVCAISFDGGEYSTAILSKYPITSLKIVQMDNNQGAEGRSVGVAKIDVLGETICFINTHIAYESPELNLYHMQQLAKLVPEGESCIMTGDFNTNDFTRFGLMEGTRIVNRTGHELPSFPSTGMGIDNIVMTVDWHFRDEGLAEHKNNSDHRLLYATLERVVGE